MVITGKYFGLDSQTYLYGLKVVISSFILEWLYKHCCGWQDIILEKNKYE